MGTETLLQRIYIGQKYPHIYTLSISTGKNQNSKICCALYIPTYEYNYKVITGCGTILQNITSPDRRKCKNTKRYTIITIQIRIQSHNRKTLEPSKGVWKDRASNGLLLIYYAFAAPL